MPVAVMCPSCSANFSVKDELAGKRAKCPKCGEPLTIPGGAPVAPTPTPAVAVPASVAKPVARPVAARPVAVPVKQTDEEDDRPKSKKRRDDEDEQPRDRKRRDDDDEGDEDRPKGKRRRDDDDKPKKKSALPLILGILGAVVLVCGGGCGGLYWFVLKPIGEEAKRKNDEIEAEINKALSKETKQRPAEEPPAVTMEARAFYKLSEAERKQYDKKWVQLTGPVPSMRSNTYLNKPEDGWIEIGTARIGTITCDFGPTEWAAKPKFDDEKSYTVIGLCEAGTFVTKLTWCRVVGESGGATKLAPLALLANPAQYKSQKVELTGVIKTATAIRPAGEVVLTGESNGNSVKLTFDPPEWRKTKMNAGDTLTVKGTVGDVSGGFVVVSNCVVVSNTGGGATAELPTDPNGPVVTTDDAMIQAFIKDVTSPDRLYKGKQVKLTGKVVDVTAANVLFGGTEAQGYTHYLLVKMASLTTIKKGDTVTLVGKYQNYESSLTNGSRTITLTDGKFDVAVTPAPTGPTITPAQLVQDFEKYKGQVVTVRGKIYMTTEELNLTKGTAYFDKIDGSKLFVVATMDKGNWRSGFLTKDDTIEVRGRVAGPLGNPSTGQYIDLQDAELLKRTTKDGKDVPIPAKVVPPTRPADSEAIEVTATALVDEFLKDAKEAEAKYKGKLLKVTGAAASISPVNIRFAGKTEKVTDPKTKRTSDYDCHVTATIEDGGKVFEDAKGKTAVIGVFKRFDVNDLGTKKSKVVFLEQCKQVK